MVVSELADVCKIYVASPPDILNVTIQMDSTHTKTVPFRDNASIMLAWMALKRVDSTANTNTANAYTHDDHHHVMVTMTTRRTPKVHANTALHSFALQS